MKLELDPVKNILKVYQWSASEWARLEHVLLFSFFVFAGGGSICTVIPGCGFSMCIALQCA